MDKKPFDFLFYLLRLIGDIILISAIQTIFRSSMKVTEKTRRALLLSSGFMIVINILGIFRNSFTLWKYQDFMSYFWLSADILQLLYCAAIWFTIYFIFQVESAINKSFLKLFMAASIIFCVLNIYNFLVNFKWLHIEGFKIFVFWFVNNGAHVLYCAAMAYLIYVMSKTFFIKTTK